jgi:hypothetical protein
MAPCEFCHYRPRSAGQADRHWRRWHRTQELARLRHRARFGLLPRAEWERLLAQASSRRLADRERAQLLEEELEWMPGQR